MSHFRPTVDGMTGYVPGEQPQGGGYVKLNTNENPYPPSPKVLEALRAAVNGDVRLYPDPVAQKVRVKAAEVYGLKPDNVLVGNGSDDLLTIVVRACVDVGDAIAFPVPTYSLYRTLGEIQGARIVEAPFADDYALPAALAETKARITFLANPNSPSGTMTSVEDVADLASRVSGVLVVDEAYVDFAAENCLHLVREAPNVVVLRTFSKSFSMCGVRAGLAFAAPELIDGMMKVKDSYNVNRFAAVAAVAALDDMDHMLANATKIKATRARLTGELRAMGMHVYPSQANFILARVPAAGERLPAAELYRELKQRRVLVRYFDAPRLTDCLRISIGTDEEIDTLLRGMRALWRNE